MDGFEPAPAGYLDAVGGQPLLGAARTAWSAAQSDGWADPSRLHHPGRKAGMLLDAARSSIATSLSGISTFPVAVEEVFFAPSVAVAARLAMQCSPGRTVIGAVESALLLDLADQRSSPAVIAVDPLGRVDPTTFAAQLANADLGCLQAANAEVGTRQPLDGIRGMSDGAASTRDALLQPTPIIMDAGQVIGRSTLPNGWSMLLAGARDWAGPAGLAILVVRRGTRMRMPTDLQRGWLGGIPDIPAAVSAATALEYVLPRWRSEADRAHDLVEAIRVAAGAIPDVEVLGDPVDRLPHVVTFSALYVSGEALVTELDRLGIAVSSGSACVAESARPSHVLAAMGAFTGGNVRVSLPFGCTEATVQRLIDALPAAVAHARGEALRA